MTYEIHNDPMPRSKSGGPKYPFPDLEVGQCFYVPVGRRKPDSIRSVVATAAGQFGRRHGKRFSIRLDRENNRVGVWRVE